MTFLPNDVFKKILEFCDDRIERQQMIDKRNVMIMIRLLRYQIEENASFYMPIELYQYYNEMLFLSDDNPPHMIMLETNYVRDAYTRILRMYTALGTYGKVFIPDTKILKGK